MTYTTKCKWDGCNERITQYKGYPEEEYCYSHRYGNGVLSMDNRSFELNEIYELKAKWGGSSGTGWSIAWQRKDSSISSRLLFINGKHWTADNNFPVGTRLEVTTSVRIVLGKGAKLPSFKGRSEIEGRYKYLWEKRHIINVSFHNVDEVFYWNGDLWAKQSIDGNEAYRNLLPDELETVREHLNNNRFKPGQRVIAKIWQNHKSHGPRLNEYKATVLPGSTSFYQVTILTVKGINLEVFVGQLEDDSD